MQSQRFREVKATRRAIGVQNNFNFPSHTTEGTAKQNTPLRTIWWPKKKPLIESLHERVIGNKLLVDELHDRLLKDKNRMVVIIESMKASELTGMGGIGKTLTATWYAHKYEYIYDHVVWIDCGEGSLLTSFQKLARDLDIKNRSELVDEEEFSTKSYEELMHYKCLWIFDNAENYKGQGGIKRVLPKYMNNFSCLITSRSRDWGVKNIGYGQISDLQLDIFSEQESMDFFEDNINKEIKYTEFQLKEFCRLMGYLPLAMQLAVSALNQGKIDLENYIDKTSTQDVENIVGVEFDDYEKTINASVKTTLDVLEREKNGIVAKDILNIFGYIQPDDVLPDLFQEVLKLNFEEVNKGIELLEKYSLISKESKTIDKESKLFVNIHRLLQQVVRHNGRDHERETLKNIFSCEGFVDYKLLPFTKFADEELRKEFPKVKAELMDQQQLVKLVREKKFEKSVQLSKFIDKELQRDATKFNYAICLEMNGQLEDNIIILEGLYKREMKEELKHEMEMGLLKLGTDVTKSLVGGHLLVSHWIMNNTERLQDILQERKSFMMIGSEERISTLLRILNSNLIQSNYSLTKDYFGGLAFKVLQKGKKRINLHNCFLDFSIPLPIDLQELILYEVQFKDGNVKYINMIDISEWIPRKLNTLQIGVVAKEIMLSLKCISSIEDITLSDCSLNLDSTHRISPKQLNIRDLFFVKDGKELSNVNVTEFIDFPKMNRLQLLCIHKTNISIDLSEESVDIEYLNLWNVDVICLKSANGRVKIKEARIENCSLDMSILPTSLKTLTLSLGTKVFMSGGIDLPNLKYLKLHIGISPTSHFQFLQLTYLYLDGVREVNVDLLPRSIKIVQINRIDRIHRMIDGDLTTTKFLGGVIHLEKLILVGFSSAEVVELLPHFHLKQLVLHVHFVHDSYKPQDLIQLMDKQIPTIAIGKVDWKEEDLENSILFKKTDQKSEYYLFHEGSRTALEKTTFLRSYLRQDIFKH